MSGQFDGKTVLVTGSAGGLGREIATAFAEKGAAVVLADMDAERLQATEKEMSAAGHAVSAVVADLSGEAGITALAEAFAAQHDRLDVLVNNAGLAYGQVSSEFLGLGMDKWLHFLAVNTVAPLLLAEALRPQLAAAPGIVINQSSMVSYVPATAYAVTKAALNAMTFGMAMQFSPDGIRCVAVAPGMMETDTNIHDVSEERRQQLRNMQLSPKRPGNPRDIANMCLFLASEEASFVNNAIFDVDGGSQLRGWRV